MSVKEAKRIRNMKNETLVGRVRQMVEMRNHIINIDGVGRYYVRVMKGNDKTGEECYTVSLIPIADCYNCKLCQKECYDIINDCWRPDVMRSRAVNSAIHKEDIDRYWAEISSEIKRINIKELRINVGGDLMYDDFIKVKGLGEDNRGCSILFFTKSDDDLNRFIDENLADYPDNYGFPENVSPILSRWKGLEYSNPYHVPESHVLYVDGNTTAPLSDELKQMIHTLVTSEDKTERMALLWDIIVKMREEGLYYCGGNCTECHFSKEGCWALKAGQHVIFPAH